MQAPWLRIWIICKQTKSASGDLLAPPMWHAARCRSAPCPLPACPPVPQCLRLTPTLPFSMPQNFGTRMARDFDKAADLYLGGLFEKINAVGQVRTCSCMHMARMPRSCSACKRLAAEDVSAAEVAPPCRGGSCIY